MLLFFSENGGIMAFRVVLIENEVNASVKLNNLVIKKNGEDIWIPIDDISVVVFDCLSSTFTARMLCSLAESGICLVICDQKHLPIGYYGAYDNHSRSSKVIGFQINNSSEFYDCLWTKIIEKKIVNQANAYSLIKKDEKGYEKILDFAKNILPGDSTNREAHAAKVYFNLLMGQSFSRGNDGILLNSGLDYGYSIIRSYIARLCVGYGLNTQIGIHHKNEYNRFNLVDDLIEPIRPFIDLKAYKLLSEADYFLPEHRHSIIDILNNEIKYHGKKMYFANMLDDYVEQFSAFLQGRKDEILFPDVLDFDLE